LTHAGDEKTARALHRFHCPFQDGLEECLPRTTTSLSSVASPLGPTRRKTSGDTGSLKTRAETARKVRTIRQRPGNATVYELTFPAPQNRELFRPGDRNVEAFEHQELGELGQLDGQQLAAFSAILLSARASAWRLASDSSRTSTAGTC
jgi:hypothetical protein